ncbi:MAG: chorismate mutase [bacterium]|nr:chorismate mutase [bacterium]
MSSAVRALRGATTVDVDQPEHIQERMIALLTQLFERNDLQHEDLISIIFTATADIHSAFPAAAARVFGLGDVPLLCAQELQIHQSQPMCLRVLIHFNTERQRQELHHVYLEDAKGLRDDLLE